MNIIKYGLLLSLIAGDVSMIATPQSATDATNRTTTEYKHPIKVRYTNWRNETAVRSIVPLEVYFGKTEYHPQEQWLLKVWDVERGAERVYALKEISQWF